MDTKIIADAFTALCAKGEFTQAGQTYWSDDIVSCEAMPGDMAEIKGVWWYANHDVHSVKVEGPYVHGHQFLVRFTMDVTPKGGARMKMDEMGLYSVLEGKIVEERFFFGSST
jgi:hypothetical protein